MNEPTVEDALEALRRDLERPREMRPTQILISATEARTIIARYGALNWVTYCKYRGVEP